MPAMCTPREQRDDSVAMHLGVSVVARCAAISADMWQDRGCAGPIARAGERYSAGDVLLKSDGPLSIEPPATELRDEGERQATPLARDERSMFRSAVRAPNKSSVPLYSRNALALTVLAPVQCRWCPSPFEDTPVNREALGAFPPTFAAACTAPHCGSRTKTARMQLTQAS